MLTPSASVLRPCALTLNTTRAIISVRAVTTKIIAAAMMLGTLAVTVGSLTVDRG